MTHYLANCLATFGSGTCWGFIVGPAIVAMIAILAILIHWLTNR